jgi:hypothetical protein
MLAAKKPWCQKRRRSNGTGTLRGRSGLVPSSELLERLEKAMEGGGGERWAPTPERPLPHRHPRIILNPGRRQVNTWG